MAQKIKGVNPWLSIWTKPRATVGAIVKFDPKYRFLALSAIYGFPLLLNMAQTWELGSQLPLYAIIIGAFLLAIPLGMLGITISTALIYWTGKWIGGKASFYPVRAAVSWSSVPTLLPIITWFFIMMTWGSSTFTDAFGQSLTGGQRTLLNVTMFVQLISTVWSIVILAKGLGQVQGFSAWKGLLNALIPFVIVVLLLWVITWLFWVGGGAPTQQG